MLRFSLLKLGFIVIVEVKEFIYDIILMIWSTSSLV